MTDCLFSQLAMQPLLRALLPYPLYPHLPQPRPQAPSPRPPAHGPTVAARWTGAARCIPLDAQHKVCVCLVGKKHAWVMHTRGLGTRVDRAYTGRHLQQAEGCGCGVRAGQFTATRSRCLSVNKTSMISIHFILYTLLISHLYWGRLKGKGIRCPSPFR